MVLLYTMYLPYLQAVERVRRRYPDLKACVIVTDLPNELGLASGRKGLPRQIEYKRGRRSMELCRRMDAFVLLTRPMADALGVNGKPCLVIEGLIQHGEDIALPAEGRGSPGAFPYSTAERWSRIWGCRSCWKPLRSCRNTTCGFADREA